MRAEFNEAKTTLASNPIIAITTKSSISVKPRTVADFEIWPRIYVWLLLYFSTNKGNVHTAPFGRYKEHNFLNPVRFLNRSEGSSVEFRDKTEDSNSYRTDNSNFDRRLPYREDQSPGSEDILEQDLARMFHHNSDPNHRLGHKLPEDILC